MTCVVLAVVSGQHRVGRVLSFFSSRRNWDSPTPLAAGECAPLPPFDPGGGGGHTRLRERGVPIPTRGHTLWCSINTRTLWRQATMVICRSSCKDRGGDFGGVNELARQDQLCAEHSLSGRKIAVFPESCWDTQHHPREVIVPVGGDGPGPPGFLKPPVDCGTSPPTRSTAVGKQWWGCN